MDLGIFVCVPLTRFAEKPSEQDGPDADCRELLHPGHGVWQPDVLSLTVKVTLHVPEHFIADGKS